MKHQSYFWIGLFVGIIIAILIYVGLSLYNQTKKIDTNLGTKEYQKIYGEAKGMLIINDWCILKCKEYDCSLISYSSDLCYCGTSDKQIKKIKVNLDEN